MQLSLLKDDRGTQTLLRGADPSQCRISRFNTRKVRDDDAVTKLAKRIDRNGFELTRALWAYLADDNIYEVFAGGTRLEAARAASVTVDIVLHDGYSWETISRLSDQDNENDEYHIPVRPADVWAEYARLRDIEGWTQQKTADVKGVTRTLVTMRLQWYDGLPDSIKDAVGLSTSVLTEKHLQTVFGNCQPVDNLAAWADIDTWRVNALTWAHHKKKSSRQLSEYWQQHKGAIERAAALADKITEGEQDEYILDGDEITRVGTDYRAAFVDLLIAADARNVAAVDSAFMKLSQRMKLSAERKAAYDDDLDADEQRVIEEAAQLAAIAEQWILGDCVAALPSLNDGSVRLLLTDPPYGVDFQSNRRVVDGKEEKLENDGNVAAAVKTFSDMLDAIAPKLADEAHLLIFAHWRTEFTFRKSLIDHGYEIRGSLVWVKENHTSGDLEGAFAPQHERIIHATKGRPKVSPRKPDVFNAARGTRTEHPTEKPIELLATLIECTTSTGDLVVDPFAGVASSPLASTKTGRKWWGCEIERKWWGIGYEELKSV